MFYVLKHSMFCPSYFQCMYRRDEATFESRDSAREDESRPSTSGENYCVVCKVVLVTVRRTFLCVTLRCTGILNFGQTRLVESNLIWDS